MPLTRRIRSFHDRYPYLGPIFWVLSIQYYVIQLIVAAAWSLTPYSWLHNTISDLGNTACGPYITRVVCSPLHPLMNASFIVLGSTMILGSLLVYHEFQRSVGSAIGFSFMAVAGFGTALVGLFPENTVPALHIFGAALPFLLGNLSLLILGKSLGLPRALRAYTLLSGGVSLIALVLFVTQADAGLGLGGMERVAAYPQTIWLIVFGVYIARDRYQRQN
jgi:hypothetical membrane protein